MDKLIIGNVVMFIGAVLMACVGMLKNKKAIIAAQICQLALMAIGGLLLGSIPCAVVNALAIIRNFLCYKDKFSKYCKVGFIVSMSLISGIFNNLGAMGLLPILATALLTVFMDTESVVKLKWALIASASLWMIHDAYIQAYSVLIFDILTIVTNFVSLKKLQKKTTELCQKKNIA